MKLPIISLAILGGQAFLAYSTNGDTMRRLNAFQSYYTGVDLVGGSFAPQNLVIGYAPWLVKRFVMPIARPRVPLKGLPVSLS